MCIAIYKPPGKWASKRRLKECFSRNPDGAGFAYYDGQKAVIEKGFFDFPSFWRAYRARVDTETKALIHFRIATIGPKDAANCHPYQLLMGVMMHNGPRLNWKHCDGDAVRSDSRQFAEDFIYSLSPKQFEDISPMIADFIGTEKLVTMYDDGSVYIVNEKEGVWTDGCWWSNTSYEPWTTRKSTNPAWWEKNYPAKNAEQRKLIEEEIKNETAADADDLYEFDARFPTEGGSFIDKVEVWSPGLKILVPRKVHMYGADFVWNEDYSAYIVGELSEDAAESGGIVYDRDKDNSDRLVVAGYVVGDRVELDDLLEEASEQELDVRFGEGKDAPLLTH